LGIGSVSDLIDVAKVTCVEGTESHHPHGKISLVVNSQTVKG
jgi:hypothetical protein